MTLISEKSKTDKNNGVDVKQDEFDMKPNLHIINEEDLIGQLSSKIERKAISPTTESLLDEKSKRVAYDRFKIWSNKNLK